MSTLGSRLRARALTFVATVAAVLFSLTIPAPAADALGLPDLTIPAGSRSVTVRTGQAFAVIHYVNNIATANASAPAKVVWRFVLPTGFTIDHVNYSGPSIWACSHTATVASCTSQTQTRPGDTTRFRIDVTAQDLASSPFGPSRPVPPGTYSATSTIDFANLVAESNEGNNQFTTPVTVTP